MFDGEGDVPFFVAEASFFLFHLKHPSKGTQETTDIVHSQNFHFFKLRKWFILKPQMTVKTSSRLSIHELADHRSSRSKSLRADPRMPLPRPRETGRCRVQAKSF